MPFIQLLINALNHLLKNEPWACEKLSRYAKKAVKFTLPLGDLILAINNDGMVCPFTDEPIAVKLTLPYTTIFSFFLENQVGALKHIRIEGDADFAETLLELINQLHWEIEEDLAKLIGPIGAHFCVKTARKTRQQYQHFLQSNLENWVEYALYEQPTLVPRYSLEKFTQQVVILRDDLARLEKRIERLQNKPIISPLSIV